MGSLLVGLPALGLWHIVVGFADRLHRSAPRRRVRRVRVGSPTHRRADRVAVCAAAGHGGRFGVLLLDPEPRSVRCRQVPVVLRCLVSARTNTATTDQRIRRGRRAPLRRICLRSFTVRRRRLPGRHLREPRSSPPGGPADSHPINEYPTDEFEYGDEDGGARAVGDRRHRSTRSPSWLRRARRGDSGAAPQGPSRSVAIRSLCRNPNRNRC